MVRYQGDIHADVEDNAETVAARINELYQAMLTVEGCGASPELTEAVSRLGERMRVVRRKAAEYIHYDDLA